MMSAPDGRQRRDRAGGAQRSAAAEGGDEQNRGNGGWMEEQDVSAGALSGARPLPASTTPQSQKGGGGAPDKIRCSEEGL